MGEIGDIHLFHLYPATAGKKVNVPYFPSPESVPLG